MGICYMVDSGVQEFGGAIVDVGQGYWKGLGFKF